MTMNEFNAMDEMGQIEAVAKGAHISERRSSEALGCRARGQEGPGLIDHGTEGLHASRESDARVVADRG